MPPGPYRIVLADDHPLMRESIATFIEDQASDQLQVVAQVADGISAVEAAEKHSPDLMLLDLSMPRLDGLGAIPRIKAFKKSILLLILSSYEDPGHVLEAIRAGADDYLFKKYATAEVVVANILRALGGRPTTEEGPLKKLLDTVRSGATFDPAAHQLTGLEVEVLKYQAYQGASNLEIADQLALAGIQVSEAVVAKHVEHILEKLRAKSPSHAVCLAIKQNLLVPDEAQPY